VTAHTLASYVNSLAVWRTNTVQVRNSPRVTIYIYSGLNAATNVTTDVSPEPAILQIQDNGNDLEEGGGDDFVDRYAAR
jgi:hypothetical protein